MSHLTVQQRSLVAIGAALASNCIPCIKFHIQKGLRVGLTTPMIEEALETAESVRQVPAQNVREAASAALQTAGEPAARPEGKAPCGAGGEAAVSNENAGSTCCGPEAGP